MKVAFTGPSGTGKSTTMSALLEKAKEFADFKVCPIGSREVSKEMGFESPYDVDAFGKRSQFQHKLFELKREWEDKTSNFITDRTHLDNLVYSIMHDCVGTVTTKFIDEIFEACQKYDLIVVFPQNVFLDTSDDSQRVHNIEYHKTYQKLLDMFLFEFSHSQEGLPADGFDVGIMRLKKADLDYRVDKIVRTIKLLNEKS